MRIAIVPDSFKGTLSAKEAAEEIERGLKRALPGLETVLVPVADGGEGTVESMADALDGRLVEVDVHDPLGRPRKATLDRAWASTELVPQSVCVSDPGRGVYWPNRLLTRDCKVAFRVRVPALRYNQRDWSAKEIWHKMVNVWHLCEQRSKFNLKIPNLPWLLYCFPQGPDGIVIAHVFKADTIHFQNHVSRFNPPILSHRTPANSAFQQVNQHGFLEQFWSF